MIDNDCLPREVAIVLSPIKRDIFEQLPNIAQEVLLVAGFNIE